MLLQKSEVGRKKFSSWTSWSRTNLLWHVRQCKHPKPPNQPKISVYIQTHTQHQWYGITKVQVREKSLLLSGQGTLPKRWTILLENHRELSFLKNCWHFKRQEDFHYTACCQLSFQNKPIPLLLLLCQGRTVRESSSWDDTWEAELHL